MDYQFFQDNFHQSFTLQFWMSDVFCKCIRLFFPLRGKRTLQAEPFLTVHMLCTEKRRLQKIKQICAEPLFPCHKNSSKKKIRGSARRVRETRKIYVITEGALLSSGSFYDLLTKYFHTHAKKVKATENNTFCTVRQRREQWVYR